MAVGGKECVVGGVVNLEYCDGVLEGLSEVLACDAVVYATGSDVFVVCDGMY